jgi:hypothetical protein
MMKRLIDYAHDEVIHVMLENERLKARIAELEKLVSVNNHQPVQEIVKDDELEEDAMDFPFEEEESDVEEEKSEEKVVVITKEKSRKDYQREYQKLYRQKKKQEDKK